MPGIELCGRQWRWASDDVTLFSLVIALLHLAWVIVLVVFVPDIAHSDTSSCQSRKYVEMLSALGCLMFLQFIVASVAFFVSLRGSIWETKKRSAVAYLVPCSWILELGVLAVTSAGRLSSLRYAKLLPPNLCRTCLTPTSTNPRRTEASTPSLLLLRPADTLRRWQSSKSKSTAPSLSTFPTLTASLASMARTLPRLWTPSSSTAGACKQSRQAALQPMAPLVSHAPQLDRVKPQRRTTLACLHRQLVSWIVAYRAFPKLDSKSDLESRRKYLDTLCCMGGLLDEFGE